MGINRVTAPDLGPKTCITGEVDFAHARKIAGGVTPVPDCIGPMTIACLVANMLSAYCHLPGLPGRPISLEHQEPT